MWLWRWQNVLVAQTVKNLVDFGGLIYELVWVSRCGVSALRNVALGSVMCREQSDDMCLMSPATVTFQIDHDHRTEFNQEQKEGNNNEYDKINNEESLFQISHPHKNQSRGKQLYISFI